VKLNDKIKRCFAVDETKFSYNAKKNGNPHLSIGKNLYEDK